MARYKMLTRSVAVVRRHVQGCWLKDSGNFVNGWMFGFLLQITFLNYSGMGCWLLLLKYLGTYRRKATAVLCQMTS